MSANPRKLAFLALRDIYRQETYSDIALDRVLRSHQVSSLDRGLATELVYGIVRRQRSLDAIIDQLGKKKAHQQPPDLRIVLHLGLYQLRYLEQIPPSAAVNTSVELAKQEGLKKLAGVVNGLLRQYNRLAAQKEEPLQLPKEEVTRLGLLHSFPDWLIKMWQEQLGIAAAEQLCFWFNQPPHLDLRINPLRTTPEEVELALTHAGIPVTRIPNLPQALRLIGKVGAIPELPGFSAGWWTLQDSSAQLVSHLLDPQPGETIIDACAAPGGKTTHIAELMQDQGKIWACDRATKRLNKLKNNCQRLQLNSIALCPGDSREFDQFAQLADRVLVDAPCSGLGTLHRRPDLRWRQNPEQISSLPQLQQELLQQAATWVKPGGILVYATCTLNRQENEAVITGFCENHRHWHIQPPPSSSVVAHLVNSQGWLKILPYEQQMDGFFMVRLQRGLMS